jgi:hypothetical protein
MMGNELDSGETGRNRAVASRDFVQASGRRGAGALADIRKDILAPVTAGTTRSRD